MVFKDLSSTKNCGVQTASCEPSSRGLSPRCRPAASPPEWPRFCDYLRINARDAPKLAACAFGWIRHDNMKDVCDYEESCRPSLEYNNQIRWRRHRPRCIAQAGKDALPEWMSGSAPSPSSEQWRIACCVCTEARVLALSHARKYQTVRFTCCFPSALYAVDPPSLPTPKQAGDASRRFAAGTDDWRERTASKPASRWPPGTFLKGDEACRVVSQEKYSIEGADTASDWRPWSRDLQQGGAEGAFSSSRGSSHSTRPWQATEACKSSMTCVGAGSAERGDGRSWHAECRGMSSVVAEDGVEGACEGRGWRYVQLRVSAQESPVA